MTSQELLQVAIENPKSFKIAQLSKERTHLITLYLFGRCYPVSGGSRGEVGYTVHDYTTEVASILDRLGLPYRIGNDAQPKNLACNYIELV